MNPSDLAFERLQYANPHAVTEVERPTGEQFLAAVTLSPVRPARTSWRRPFPAVAAAVLVLILALPIVLYVGAQRPPVTETPSIFAPDIPPLVAPPTTCSENLNQNINCFEEPLTGSYLIDQLGTQFTLTIEDSWIFHEGHDGFVSLGGPGQRGAMVFVRPTSLSNPVNPFTPITDTSWLVDDIDGWLNRLDSRVATSNIVSVDIGGKAALRFDMTVDELAPCYSTTICASFVTNRNVDTVSLDPDVSIRVWWVATDDEAPVVIVASGVEGFLETASAVVETIDFGPTQPHPIPAGNLWELGFNAQVPPGQVRIPGLGGVEFTLETDQNVEQSDDHVELETSAFAGVVISYLIAGPDGEPIGSIDDVAAHMASEGVTLNDAGSADSLLEGGRVFDLVRGPDVSRSLTFVNGEDGRTWRVPAAGRLWLFETERGVLMVSAGTLEGTFGRDEAMELGQSIVSTLTLIDPSSLSD